MLIGRPAHGIAWWDELTAPSGGTPDRRPRAGRAGHAGGRRPPGLPAHGHGRRAPPRRGALPAGPGPADSAAGWPVGSSDGSVELPEARPATLVLSVRHDEGHRLELTWTRGGEGTEGRERLWGAAGPVPRPGGRGRPSWTRWSADRSARCPALFERRPGRGAPGPRGPARRHGRRPVRHRPAARPGGHRRRGRSSTWAPCPTTARPTAAPVVSLGGQASRATTTGST